MIISPCSKSAVLFLSFLAMDPCESDALNATSNSAEVAYDLAWTYQLLGPSIEATELRQLNLTPDDPRGRKADLARKRPSKMQSTDQGAPGRDDSIQEASLRFFLPVVIAYLLACGGWIILARWGAIPFANAPLSPTDRPWLELAMAGLVAVGIFAGGFAYRFGLLLPSGSGWLHHVSWTLNNVIIYSPLFIMLAIRKQSLDTVFISPTNLGRKTAVGGILAIAATIAFLGLRGELTELPGVLLGVVEPDNATNFIPVFLEGVALVFLFVRVRWALGTWPAILIPAVLFAVAHIPSQLAAEESLGTMIAFFVLNTLLPAAILYVIVLSRDVVWIAVVHYVMDIAIKAFE